MTPEQRASNAQRSAPGRDGKAFFAAEERRWLARIIRAAENAALERAAGQAWSLLTDLKSEHAYQVLAEIRALKSRAPRAKGTKR